VGQTAKGPILSLPSPQDSMQSPKVWAEYRMHELAMEVWGHSLQKIFKIWVSETAISCILRTHLEKSQLFKTKF
jgi:hypothetical protein